MAAQDNNNSVIASEERAKQSAVLVPQLRFKEFDEEWEESNFGSINTVLDSLHQTPKEYTEQGYPMIRVTDVNDGKLCINKCLKVSKLDFIEFTKRHIPKKGDIIMSRVGTCGASIKLSTDEPVCLGQNTVLLISKIHKHYMFSFMKSRYFQNQVDRMVVGSTQKTLSLRDLKKFKINLPSLKEQQKIATFLTAVDDKISQLTSKKEQLTQYKKGVMQQLFSQELRFQPDGSTTSSKQPSLRGAQQRSNLPDENSPSTSNENQFPDWEEKRLGEVCEIIGGGTPDTTIKEYWDGDIQWFTPTEVDKRLIGKSKRTISKLA